MNIVLLNQNWLRYELAELGHNVISAGWMANLYDITIEWGASSKDLLQKVKEHFEPDIFVYYDNSSLPTILDIENLEYPKIFVSVDTFHHLPWHSDFSNFFNITLVAQKDYVEKLSETRNNHSNVYWFPLWVNHYWEPEEPKTYEVSFRGTLSKTLHPERYTFFEKIAAEVPLDFGQGSIHDVYPRSKIVINQAVRGDINFRNYEAMMGGAMLLTPMVNNGITDLFTDGENCVFYEDGNADDAISKLKYYLENDDERIRIAKNGRMLVLEKHSSLPTAKKLESYIMMARNTGHVKSKNSSIVIQTFIARALWHMLRKENDEKYMQPIEKSLNTLQKELLDKGNPVVLNPELETTLVIADLICADILDVDSYSLWRHDFIDAFPDLTFTALLNAAYQEGPEKNDAFSHLSSVRYTLVKRILNVE